MKSIKKHKKLENLKVLLRTDFNVPLGSDGKVSKDEATRIEKSLETINFLRKNKAKVIIISHIGRDQKDSLKPVAEYLAKKIKIRFIEGHTQDFVHEVIDTMKAGDVVMLENLRQDIGETENSSAFARGLSRLADVYVNDAFAVCHRRHASIVGIPKFLESYSGFQLDSEISHLAKIATNPKKPFLFILGGAKFETKLPLIKKFIKIADYVFVGGALQNNFFKAKGLEVGKSLVDDKRYNLGGLVKTDKILLPRDVVVTNAGKTKTVLVDNVGLKDTIVDIGPETINDLSQVIAQSKTILWNGPLGLYEKGFDESTKKIAKQIAKSKSLSIIGGGDTVVTIQELKLENKIDFVSTGGGAMLEFLQKGKLPGITALEK